METSVSAQLYVMTIDSLCCPGKDNRPQNQHKAVGESGGIIIKVFTSITITSCKENVRLALLVQTNTDYNTTN